MLTSTLSPKKKHQEIVLAEYLYDNNSKVYSLVLSFRILFQRTQKGLKIEVSSKNLRVQFSWYLNTFFVSNLSIFSVKRYESKTYVCLCRKIIPCMYYMDDILQFFSCKKLYHACVRWTIFCNFFHVR